MLAIVAAKLGFAPVMALDYDRAATAATRENAARNGVELDVRDFDMRDRAGPGRGLWGGKRARRPTGHLGRVPA